MVCKNCGKELLPLAVYCTECGARVSTEIDFSYQQEDERDFAFHKEYYGFGYDGTGYPYAWFDGSLYRIYDKPKGNSKSDTYLLKIQDQKIADSFYIGEESVSLLGANRYGLFLRSGYQKKIALYDFLGKKQSEFSIREVFGDDYDMHMTASYIFKNKLYFSLCRKKKGASLKEIGMCVKAYDFCTGRLEDVWSLQKIAEPIEAFLRQQLQGMLKEYDGEEKWAKKMELDFSSEEYLFVNSQYMILPCQIYANDSAGQGYQAECDMVLLVDLASGACVNLKGFQPHKQRAVRFDLKENKMWLETNSGQTKIWKKFPIGILEQAKQEEDIWSFDKGKLQGANWDGEVYFDGIHFYATGYYMYFYACDRNGATQEWSDKSGHGSVCAAVYGPYVYPCLDMDDTKLYPHAVCKPEEGGYSIDQEEADAVIEAKRMKEQPEQKVFPEVCEDMANEAFPKEQGEPESIVFSEEWKAPEKVYEPVCEEHNKTEHKEVSEAPENVESVLEAASVLKFREYLEEHSDYADRFKEYRKGLKDRKWDFNAVMGILLGSCKRHASGIRHIQEQNAGIGQGDNGDNVVKALEKHGLMSVYKKYETISDTELRMSKVISEITMTAPQLLDICDAIRDILEQD